MRMHSKLQLVLVGAAVVVSMVCRRAQAQPVVPGFTVTTYATIDSPGLERLTFGNNGDLFVGHGPQTPAKIYRIPSGGGTVQEYGPDLYDADAVLFDRDGRFGPPGSVLTGGGVITQPYLARILPDQSVQYIFGPGGVAFSNPTDMEFDTQGRLVFVDITAKKAFASTGDDPYLLCDIPESPTHIAINSADHIFVSCQDLTIREYASDGSFERVFASDLGFAGAQSIPIAFAQGGLFNPGLYAISSGTLIRFDATGNQHEVGTGFDGGVYTDIAFGPDGGLYISDNGEGIIRIIPEPATLSLLALGGLALLRRRES